ncbi:MAG TPA: FAD-dependent oxidoreductase [Candidatus Thermoplasmatota archaeon]|nr:FAD-dependent oxidoreductase [Candidatus Thermoplasmatota archaeon]
MLRDVIFRGRVLESRKLTPSVHGIRVEKPPDFRFRPVQFVGLEIGTEEGPVEYTMSMASSPTRPHIEFGARLSASPWKRAFAALSPGDEVEIDGPYGHFVLDESRPAVLVAGGVGITPLKGMLEYATDRALALPVTLLYSNRTPEEIAYRTEIDALAAANARARVVHTISRPSPGDGWKGRTGRIDATLLSQTAKDQPGSKWYLCGTPSFVGDTFRALRDAGVPAADVLYERFMGYA